MNNWFWILKNLKIQLQLVNLKRFIFLLYQIMSKKLFIWNIEWWCSNEQLSEVFAQYWELEECVIVKDKISWRSKWYWFVTYVNEEDAMNAIEKLNWFDLNERPLTVKEADETQRKDRTDNRGRFNNNNRWWNYR